MYSVSKVKIWNVPDLLKVSDILYECGKYMAEKYNLHHWDNSHIKNWIIIILCALKNNIYLVYNDNKVPVATFQTRKTDQSYLFQKLATSPKFAGGGIGTFCLNEIERQAKNEGCYELICEVYDKSEHAMDFYKNRGYIVYGTSGTLKYTEYKLKKSIEK